MPERNYTLRLSAVQVEQLHRICGLAEDCAAAGLKPVAFLADQDTPERTEWVNVEIAELYQKTITHKGGTRA